MIKNVKAGERSGCVNIPASKSWAHRLLIAAALSKEPSVMICDGSSADIDATADCLRAMGAKIDCESNRISITPIARPVGEELCHLYCRESGSTLRFLVPVVGALGLNAVFHMEGRLPNRPMDVFYDCLSKMGMTIKQEGSLLYLSGRLTPGVYSIPGNISSQYISGLLLALPLLDGDSSLEVTGNIESFDYILMTEAALEASGYSVQRDGMSYKVKSVAGYEIPSLCKVESDWSSAAFLLSMGALSKRGITVRGMNLNSVQGDKRVVDILKDFGAFVTVSQDEITVKGKALHGIEVDAAQIPDLVPVIATVAAFAEGKTRIYNAQRLVYKESDRLSTTESMLKALGAEITKNDDGLIISGKTGIQGGKCQSFNDHRIAMSAAVAAVRCECDVIVEGAECVAKSFASFWDIIDGLSLE